MPARAVERQTAAARAALEVQLSAMSVEQLKQRASGKAGALKQTLSPEKPAENAAKTLSRSPTRRLQDDFKNTHWSQMIDVIVRSGDAAERGSAPDAEHAGHGAMRGTIGPGRDSHPDTALCIALVILRTTHPGRHENEFEIRAQARSSA